MRPTADEAPQPSSTSRPVHHTAPWPFAGRGRRVRVRLVHRTAPILPWSTSGERQPKKNTKQNKCGHPLVPLVTFGAAMDAAVSLSLHHHHGAPGALPLPATLPPPHHHPCALPLRRHPFSSAAAAPKAPPAPLLTLAARPRSPARSASPPALAHPAAAPRSSGSSSRAATGYAAALADACARAGTLRRAARHARALLVRRRRSEEEEELDARVVALVRMLVGKGKAGMVPEVLAEFAAICDHLLPRPPPAQPRHAY
ncbi:hypothetical protein SETIT_4G279500v2 [Setaria italica]|uniref:Uncharacterized protein n=2 Tax=Setaria TaxID=4554 RepID=A0A368QZ19_SETIT|nr:hypothetical protein SETIT_4G279500v2 [Setaria italica]